MMRSFITILALLVSLGASAQRFKGFTEPTAFVEELERYTGEIDKKAAKELAERITPFWMESGITIDEQKSIIAVGNEIVKKRVRPFPGFDAYLRTLEATAESPDVFELLLAKINSGAKQLRTRELEQLLVHLQWLYEDHALYQNQALSWFVDEQATLNLDQFPEIIIEGTTLTCATQGDTSRIEETTLRIDLQEETCVAQGGKIYWERAGFNRDSLYAKLKVTPIDLRKSYFESDSVTLFSKYFFSEPLLGHLNENVLSAAPGERVRYPQFTSFLKSFTLVDILPGVDFQGGFSVEGSRFIGDGDELRPAHLIVRYEGAPVFDFKAQRFTITRTKISSAQTRAVLFLDEDSLAHPQVALKIDGENKKLSLYREQDGLSMRPFVDSYHQLEMYFEQLEWEMESPSMEIKNISGRDVSPIYLESINYFRDDRFEAVQGMGEQNPLFLIERYVNSWSNRDSYRLEELADALMISYHQCEKLLLNMTILGLVDYNPTNRLFVVEEKLQRYINARKRQIDFDVIRFRSVAPNGINAKLSLLNYDMEVYGVDRIALSDSQQIFIYPRGGAIVVKEGLDMEFNGTVRAGRFDFQGRQFFFSYDEFRFNMPTIDSMKFLVPSFDTDEFGRHRLVQIRNFLSDMSGELFIDKPNNKSSQSRYPEYPIFKSGSDSYVFWNKPRIHRGAYLKNEVYFHVEPFEIDSLDDFKTEALEFYGTFYSGWIFPEMDLGLTVQDDYSLGFKSQTPPEGLPLYGGNARFYSDFDMSNKGLHGHGSVEYADATAVSSDFLFLLDSANATLENWQLTERGGAISKPKAHGQQLAMHWETKKNVMHLKNTPQLPFTLYDVNATHHGHLSLTPTALYGVGDTRFLNALTQGSQLTFEQQRFYGDTMNFRVRSSAEGDWAFALDTAKGEINFGSRKGEFDLYNLDRPLDLLAVRYQAFADHVDWNFDDASIDVYRRQQGAPSRLLSVRPDQDSLQYDALQATLFLRDSLMRGTGVAHLDVADTRIYPDSQQVVVRTQAEMDVLNEARAWVSRESKNHQLYGGSFKVNGRYSYGGTAIVDFVDAYEHSYPITLHRVFVQGDTLTRAEGAIAQTDSFYLNPFFSFHGDVFLRADSVFLQFDGYTEIQHACEYILADPIPFSSWINPKNITIDLTRFETERKSRNLYSGLFFDEPNSRLNTAFLSRLAAGEDQPLFEAGGVLQFDPAKSSYIIGTPVGFNEPGYTGNVLIFNVQRCEVNGEGTLLVSDEPSGFVTQLEGSYTHDLRQDSIYGRGALAIDFPFSKDLLEQMQRYLIDESDLPGANVNNNRYMRLLISTMSDKEIARMKEDLTNFGYLTEIPKSAQHNFLFSNMDFHWDRFNGSLLSSGNLHLSMVGGVNVNKSIPGRIELIRRRSGEDFYMFLQSDRKHWYYFNHRRDVLQTVSSIQAYNDILMGEDLKQRQTEYDKDRYFQYTLSSSRRAERFYNRFDEFFR